MWLSTISGEATWSLSSSATLAACMLWGHSPAMWIAALGTVVAELLVLRKPWMRAWFNGGQMAITMWVAGWVFTLLGGPSDGLHALPTGDVQAGQWVALRLAPAILGLFAGFLLVNRALVAVAVAWSTDRPYLRVLREDWFYAERLLEDGAAFLLAPLMVISYRAIGYVGVALFYAPLFMIYESGRRYVELQKAQRQIVHTERLAAKGEMAAEIGHELRTQLAAISGHAQMLLKDAERKVYEHVERRGRIIIEQSRRMEVMAKGLMDFSRAELNVERVDLNALVQRSIEFVRTQNRFDGVEWDLRLAEQVPALRGDPGQLQQVLLNLFVNAADAMKEQALGAQGHRGDEFDRRPRAAGADRGHRHRSRHRGLEPHAHLRAALHDQARRARLRALDLVPHHREPRRAHHRREPAGAGGVLHRHAARERVGGLGLIPAAGWALVARVDFGACVLFAEDGTLFTATVRGRVMGRKKALGNAVVVGDLVRLEAGADQVVVDQVQPRRNVFSRRAAGEQAIEQVVAANLDQVVLVTSLAQPEFTPGFADRVLAQAEHAGIPARLVLNKTDLGSADAGARPARTNTNAPACPATRCARRAARAWRRCATPCTGGARSSSGTRAWGRARCSTPWSPRWTCSWAWSTRRPARGATPRRRRCWSARPRTSS